MDRVVPDVFTLAVIDGVMEIIAAKAKEGSILIGHHGRALGDVLANRALNCYSPSVRNVESAQLTFTFDHAQNNILVRAALRAWGFPVGVFVLLFAAHKR